MDNIFSCYGSLLGGYALYLQIAKGHGVTGMRDNVVWGLYIVNFIFFIGISYAGAVISGILHILKVEWRKPIIRLAEMITVISTIIGPVFILLCVGRLDRLHHLFHLSKAAIAHYLGRIGYRYLFCRQCYFSLPRLDKRFCNLP